MQDDKAAPGVKKKGDIRSFFASNSANKEDAHLEQEDDLEAEQDEDEAMDIDSSGSNSGEDEL